MSIPELAKHRTLVRVGPLVRAEVAKALRPGGIRRWFIVAFSLGLLVSSGFSLLTLNHSARDALGLTTAGAVSTAAGVATIVLALSAAGYVTREISDGTMYLSKLVVPQPSALFAGRILGFGLVGACIGGAVAASAALIALSIPTVASSNFITVLLQIVACAAYCAVAVGLVYMAGMVVTRGANLVAVLVFVIIVLPLAIALSPLLFPFLETWTPILTGILIGSLLSKAGSIPEEPRLAADHQQMNDLMEVPPHTWVDFAIGWVGVVVWAVLLIYIAYRAFRKESFGDSA